MTNSIRTPRKGVTASSRRIAEAVDDQDWQTFRLSMKGKSTKDKLVMLQDYWNTAESDKVRVKWGDVDIRVDNYIKALCRGGQLHPGESLETALEANWQLRIKK